MTMITEETRAKAERIERAIKLMELEGFTQFVPAPLNLPKQIAPEEVTALIASCLDAGNDPAEDPAVQKAVTQSEIAEHTYRIRMRHEQSEAKRRLCNAKDQAPALIEEMKAKFDTVADVLREAYKVLGDEPLWDETAHYAPNDKNRRTRADAKAAMYDADLITNNWFYLVSALHGPLGVTAPNEVFAVPTLEDHKRLGLALGGRRRNGTNTNVWDMITMGVAVDLATTSAEVRERVATVNAARARDRAANERGDTFV